MSKLTTIRIPKGRFQKRVPVVVNGNVAHIPVETDTPVGDHILEALTNAEVEYTVISPKGETDGSESGVGSESSTVVIGAESPIDDDAGTDNGDALTNATELGGAPVETPVEIVAKTPGSETTLVTETPPPPPPPPAKVEGTAKPAKAPAKKPATKKPAAK